MSFEEQHVNSFINLFEERKSLIRHFEGCKHLELWQDAHQSNVFFTYSIWESEQHLNHYRFSELFKDTWVRTKALFSDKPQAWSVFQKMIVA
jgi:heme-degrading monooxygenase HmoA